MTTQAVLLLTACSFLLASCSTGEVAPPGSRFVVTAPRAQFYKYGPAQSFGADFVLSRGDKVTMIERSFGFSRVMTDAGITGFVASDEVGPAPPEPKATPAPKPRSNGRWFSGKPQRSDVRGTPGSPLFDVNDVPAPLPQGPAGTPKPAPKFRY